VTALLIAVGHGAWGLTFTTIVGTFLRGKIITKAKQQSSKLKPCDSLARPIAARVLHCPIEREFPSQRAS
jgi:hypothetical protein